MRRRQFLASTTIALLSAKQAAVRSLHAAEALANAAASPVGPATVEPLYWSWWGWEPPDHYRRTGGVVGAIDVDAPGFLAWYDRLHSEDLVRTMADLGINLAVTHFFKGFGLKHEYPQQQRTASLVRLAHRHGVKVLGYCQSRSLYYESFLDEQPQAEHWIQRDENGQPKTWGAAYFRWAPCIECRQFRDYMKRAITVGLKDVGLDGFQFDNDYAQPCYCPRCQQAFRDWLTQHYPSPRDRYGLATFDHVRQPPTRKPSPGTIDDPLVQDWVRYRCDSLGRYLRELTDHARSIRPDVILLNNPGHPRAFDEPYRISVWPPTTEQTMTLMFAENRNFPGLERDVLYSQIRACKEAAAVGYRIVSTTWRRGSETGLGLPQEPREVALQVAQSAAFGAVPGTNWALRSVGPGDRMQIDRDDLRATLGQYLDFVRQQQQHLAAARPVRDVAVLHSFSSLTFDASNTFRYLLGAEESLIRGGFPWEIVFGDDLSRLDGFSVLVLACHALLSDDECAAVRERVKRGAALVLIGPNGTRNENGRIRNADPWADLPAERTVRADAAWAKAGVQGTSTHMVALPKDWKRLTAAIHQAAADRFTVRLQGSDSVAIAAYELPDRRLAVHLVNYAPAPAAGLQLALGPAWSRPRQVQCLRPEAPQQALQADSKSPSSIKLPDVDVYAVVILSAPDAS